MPDSKARADKREREALFLYDGGPTNSDGLMAARQAANLMGHFGYKASLENMSAYRSGEARQADAVFVFGMADGTVVPRPLLTDLAERSGPTVWTHLHLEQLTADTNVAARLGFKYLENDDEAKFPQVIFHGVSLPNGDNQDIDRISILDSNRVQVLATAVDEDGQERVPYVVRSGQFWFFAGGGSSFSMESDVSLVFGELLHDILGVQHPNERRAMVRIEDVSANSDPDDLRRVADILSARHIPFQIALIPIFKDPNNHITQGISEAPEVVDSVKYMVAHGGAVIMHGITHQLHGVSGDDYEFWDALANRPTTDGALNILGPRVQRGLDECLRAGLYPLAFETPHYGASLEHYRSLATMFSICYERRVLSDDDNTQQFFPYTTTDIYGQKLVPENLGYEPIEKPDPGPIISAAKRLEVVRDPIASFFFHPFMPAKDLERILGSLQADGYQFVSLRSFAPTVSAGDYMVSMVATNVTVSPVRPFFKISTVDNRGDKMEETRPVEPGKPMTLSLAPPEGGLVVVRSASYAPTTPQKSSWANLWQKLRGAPAPEISGSQSPVHEVLLFGSSPPFESVFTVYGIPWRRVDAIKVLPADACLVLPHGAVLDETTQKRVAAWIAGGGRAVLEERSPLAEKLGFTYPGENFTADRIQDLQMPAVAMRTVHTMDIERFNPPTGTIPLVQTTDTELPIVVASRVGDGAVIYLGTELDPDTHLGYARFPFFVQDLRQRFGIEPPLTSDGVEFYFDPGFREKASLEKLVNAWHMEGVRAIYAAAWHIYPRWTFDYDRLIRLCHQQGIAVYAWLELPEVSPQFWEEHPEWREKTATGADAEIGWRKFMNLANPDCRAATMKFVDDLLAAHNWDGVNIAELCFDTTDGLQAPQGYIPMNRDVCDAFQQQGGFDPQRLFDTNSVLFWRRNPSGLHQWNQYRTGLVRSWLTELLDHVQRRQLDVIVTAFDSFSVPAIVEKSGCDTRDVIALMDRYNFTLQVEDAGELWGGAPSRYDQLVEPYRKLVKNPARVMFDVNVVDSRPAGLGPTKLASGTELALTIRSAAKAGNGRVGVYSEFTLLPEDRASLPFVMGALANFKRDGNMTSVATERPVRFQYLTAQPAPSRWNPFHHGGFEPWPVPIMDSKPWVCGVKGLALLPPGSHRLGPAGSASGESIWIKDITAPFTSVTETPSGFLVNYDSPRRCWLTLSREPSSVWSDGQPWTGPVVRASGWDWQVELPSGRHQVELRRGTTASVVVEQAGEKASRSIEWVGTRGIEFLAVLYVATRLRRLARRSGVFLGKATDV